MTKRVHKINFVAKPVPGSSVTRPIIEIYRLPHLMTREEAREHLKSVFNNGVTYLWSCDGHRVLPPIDIPYGGAIVEYDGERFKRNEHGGILQEVMHLLNRELVWEAFGTPFCCSVASETYWST